MRFDRCGEGFRLRRLRTVAGAVCVFVAVGNTTVPAALAQKYPGATLDDLSTPRPYVPPPSAPRPQPVPNQYTPRPPPLPSRPLAAAPREADPDARALADRLPLDPATANLEARNPPNLPGTMRQLGLRVPNGPRVDMRSHSPSTSELVDALRH